MLYGGSKGGSYQYDKKVKLSAKASDGMVSSAAPRLSATKMLGQGLPE